MEMTFTTREKIVGFFIVGIIVLLLATVVLIGRGKDWFETYVTYYTTFKESHNLTENTPVKLFNTKIGKVEKITLVGNMVNVRLAILENYAARIRTDTLASVKSPTFIGSEYVEIKPGSPDAPLTPEGGEISALEKKSIADTLAEFQVEKTAKMLIEAVQNLSLIIQSLQDPKGPLFALFDHANNSLASLDMIVQDIRSGKGTLGGILTSRALLDDIHDKIDRIGAILENVNQATAKTPETMQVVQDTLKASQTFMQGLGKAAAKAPQTLDEVQNTLKVSQKVLQDINKTTAKLPATIDQVQATIGTYKKMGAELITSVHGLKKILQDAQGAIASLNVILGNVEKGSPEIPQIINIAKGSLLDIRDAVGNLDRLIQALQNNILIRGGLPPEPKLDNIDAGLRE